MDNNFSATVKRIQAHINRLTSQYPQTWQKAEEFRQKNGNGLHWPEWCYLPTGGSTVIIENYHGMHNIASIPEHSALAPWRLSQGIYSFDPDVKEELYKTSISGEIPAQAFLGLPEWCIYIDDPELEFNTLPILGFFAHLEYDLRDKHSELRIVMDLGETTMMLPLYLDCTLEESIKKMFAAIYKNIGVDEPENIPPFLKQMVPDEATIHKMINLILYLCAEPDYKAPTGNVLPPPGRPREKKTKKGMKIFPPDKPTYYMSGFSLGDKLRYAKANDSEPTGRKQRPHVRRAHWHTYWTGAGRTTAKVRWVHPILINADQGEVTPTVRKVKPV